MDNSLEKYVARKLALLERDFRIFPNEIEHMKLAQAKNQIEVDNIVRTMFQKYL